jgi:hypothetical protein
VGVVGLVDGKDVDRVLLDIVVYAGTSDLRVGWPERRAGVIGLVDLADRYGIEVGCIGVYTSAGSPNRAHFQHSTLPPGSPSNPSSTIRKRPAR